MRLSSVLLVSLGLNAALAVLLISRRLSLDATPTPPVAAAPRESPSATPTDPIAHINPATWGSFGPDGDLAGFVAALRAKGFPPPVLRAIVAAQVRARFADRMAPLFAAAGTEPFWKGGFGPETNPKLSLALRKLQREMTELERQLLGPDAINRDRANEYDRRRYGNLSPDKIAEIERINADYTDLRSQVSAEARGTLLPEDREKLAFLEKERRADLARLLNAEELEDYELRTSRTGNQLRGRLIAFEPTEHEFRALFRLHQPLDEQFGRSDLATPELRQKRAEAEKQLTAQIEAALGPERYADYKRMTNPVWIRAAEFVRQMNLPAAATSQLVTIQQDITQRAAALRADGALNPEQRTLRFTALEQEASVRLTPILGERIEAYKQSQGGWLRSLGPSTSR